MQLRESCLTVALRSWGSIHGAEVVAGNEEGPVLWQTLSGTPMGPNSQVAVPDCPARPGEI